MQYKYEIVKNQTGLPAKVFIHSVNYFDMHWHKEIEILYILSGTVNVRVRNNRYLLKENDLILINSNEIHSTSRTDEENIILAIQINSSYQAALYQEFDKLLFQCKSFDYEPEEQEEFNVIRRCLAEIVWNMNKKEKGYELIVASKINDLSLHLLNNFYYGILEDETTDSISKEMDRLQDIINYIDYNFEGGVTLQDVADYMELSIHHLSRLIKKNLGMTFQEYLNSLRLDKAIDLLLYTDMSITDIAFESGFPSTKSLNNLFSKEFDCPPTEYRDKNSNGEQRDHINFGTIESKSYFDVDRNKAFKKLLVYLELEEDKYIENHKELGVTQNICIDANKKGSKYIKHWQKLTSFGRAAEGLRGSWQAQLREVQREIGFEYIRFHGIFSDEMMVVNRNDEGNIEYNWTYINELFDFFQRVNIKPFIELGFMPDELKKSHETIFWWKANISQPKDIRDWNNLVKAFIKHCINRYGKEEVETWYFEVWNEPELENIFWVGGKEDYFEFYKETVMAIKSISNDLKIGGPAITHQTFQNNTWLSDFLHYIRDNHIPLDYVSFHVYPEINNMDEIPEDIIEAQKNGADFNTINQLALKRPRIYADKNQINKILDSANTIIESTLDYKPEVHVTEWNASAHIRNFIHDTCFVATYIVYNAIKSIGKSDSLTYWTFTDLMEEFKLGINHFHGGFGLINKDGLKKPSYYALYLLSKLGDEILIQEEDYIVTRKGENIQILSFNYAYYDDLFMSGDMSALSNKNRYLVFESKENKNLDIKVEGLSGDYKITTYELNRKHGSVFDEWLEIGSPENMSIEEINYLKGIARPKIKVDYLKIEGVYAKRIHLPIHGVNLMDIKKVT